MVDKQEKLRRWLDINKQYRAAERRGVFVSDEVKQVTGANCRVLLEIDEARLGASSAQRTAQAAQRADALNVYPASDEALALARNMFLDLW